MARHCLSDCTSLASSSSCPMNLCGVANAFVTIAPRSSAQSQGRLRDRPINFGITCHVPTAGKNFLSVISSVLALVDLCFGSADERVLHAVDTIGTRKDRPKRGRVAHIALHYFSADRR